MGLQIYFILTYLKSTRGTVLLLCLKSITIIFVFSIKPNIAFEQNPNEQNCGSKDDTI